MVTSQVSQSYTRESAKEPQVSEAACLSAKKIQKKMPSLFVAVDPAKKILAVMFHCACRNINTLHLQHLTRSKRKGVYSCCSSDQLVGWCRLLSGLPEMHCSSGQLVGWCRLLSGLPEMHGWVDRPIAPARANTLKQFHLLCVNHHRYLLAHAWSLPAVVFLPHCRRSASSIVTERSPPPPMPAISVPFVEAAVATTPTSIVQPFWGQRAPAGAAAANTAASAAARHRPHKFVVRRRRSQSIVTERQRLCPPLTSEEPPTPPTVLSGTIFHDWL